MIPAVILAAGLSTRMGGHTKALLDAGGGVTFVARLIETFHAAGISDIVVVTGHEADRVAAAVHAADPHARVVRNPDYPLGQFTSVLAALGEIDRPGVDAFLMTLVDVPYVSAETIAAVVARYRETAAPVVRPVRGPEHGHPVLIDRSLFDLLRCADPAAGAKPIVRAHVSPAGDVPVTDAGAFFDVDTPADYRRVRNGLPFAGRE